GKGFAITTPLCMAEAKLTAKDIVAVKLPGPRITRKLMIVARHRELGQIPRELADAARVALQQQFDFDTLNDA
ncbi:MAG TPA: hypothetical protein PLD46_05315, partial [Hyphomicrobium sp.]|nr:hypothetical protein [Hyphomicrobium sp.]